jgi:hypothetical protein
MKLFSLASFRFLLGGVGGALLAVGAMAAPAALHVKGSRLLLPSGEPVRLRGVNCAGMEWSTDGEGHIANTVQFALIGWHANIIRLPLSQDRWFGRAADQADGGESYRALVRHIVDLCTEHNAYIMLDLHWSNAGIWGRNIGQHKLPDRHSLEFWKAVAMEYANVPAVLFDLYNEPWGIDWDQWFDGGPVTERDSKTGQELAYDAVGFQALVDVVRATGAKNVIVAGGTNWAYEVEGITKARQLNDRGGAGVVYAVHPYPHAYEHLGRETIPQWAARMERFAATMPMIVTEFGSLQRDWPFPKDSDMNDEKWNRQMLATLEAHGWNWLAWDLHPAAAPCLISGWNYQATPEFGVWVKQEMAGNVR